MHQYKLCAPSKLNACHNNYRNPAILLKQPVLFLVDFKLI